MTQIFSKKKDDFIVKLFISNHLIQTKSFLFQTHLGQDKIIFVSLILILLASIKGYKVTEKNVDVR